MKPGYTLPVPWYAFQRGSAVDHYWHPMGRACTNLHQYNTKNALLALDSPHIRIPGMLPYSSSTAGHAHTTSMHRTVTVYRSTVLTDYVSMHT